MSFTATEFESIQPDTFAKIDSEPWFSTISLFKIRHEDTQSKINEALGEGTFDAGQSGKLPGACIEVMMPTIKDINPSVFQVESTVEVLLRVLENHQINIEQPGGTTLSAESIGFGLLRLFQQHVCEGLASNWFGVSMGFNLDFHPLVCYDVVIGAKADSNTLPQTASVVYSESALTVTLSCATAGSTIYYTTDGSYPYAKNAKAQVYSAPFSVNANTLIRFAAYAAGYIGSPVFRRFITS